MYTYNVNCDEHLYHFLECSCYTCSVPVSVRVFEILLYMIVLVNMYFIGSLEAIKQLFSVDSLASELLYKTVINILRSDLP